MPTCLGSSHRHRGDGKLQGSDRGASRRGARRTLKLVEPLTEEQLNRVYDPILSPLIWDLGHIANFEELWLVQRIGGREPLRGDLGRFYDAIEQPRKIRGELPILRADEVRPYMEGVRERTLEVLDEIDLDPEAEDPLLRTASSTRCCSPTSTSTTRRCSSCCRWSRLRAGRGRPRPGPEPVSDGPEMVRVEGGELRDRGRRRWIRVRQRAARHGVELESFRIDRTR